MSPDLADAAANKALGTLQAFVYLNRGQPDEKKLEMEIHTHSNIVKNVVSNLDLSIVYDVVVEFQFHSQFDSSIPLTIASFEQPEYQFTINKQLFITSDQFNFKEDYDKDTASNVSEILAGGNPLNPAPTFKNPSNITMSEGILAVQNIDALSPIVDTEVTYSITSGSDREKFQLVGSTLSFLDNPVYDSSSSAQNRYEIEIVASDGAFENHQLIIINITDDFYFGIRDIHGIQSINFTWDHEENADYYKLITSSDGISPYIQAEGTSNILTTNITYDISSNPFEQLSLNYKIQAYDVNNVLINESANQIFGPRNAIIAIDVVKPSTTTTLDYEINHYDKFGSRIALSTDGSTLISGAPYVDLLGFPNAGAVKILSRPNATDSWTSPMDMQSITIDDATTGYNFGSSIEIGANNLTLVVGAIGANSGPKYSTDYPTTAGAVYVFTRKYSDSNWTSTANEKFYAFDIGATNDRFGTSSAISENSLAIAVGAPGSDPQLMNNSVSNAGAVYTFSRENDSILWSSNSSNILKDKLVASDATVSSAFGYDVAISSDGLILVVAAPFANINRDGVDYLHAGTVYTYTRSTILDNWDNATENKLMSENLGNDLNFGYCIQLSADNLTLYIGDSGSSFTDTKSDILFAGSIHVYKFDGKIWVKSDQFFSPEPYPYEKFGQQFSVSSDNATLVVGVASASIESSNVTLKSAGKAYVFHRQSLDLPWNSVRPVVLTANNPAEQNFYGTSVTVNSNGSNIAIGSPGASDVKFLDNSTIIGAGAVYQY